MKIISFYITLSLLLCLPYSLMSQDDLLSEAEALLAEEDSHYPAFKAMKIGNLQSTKVAAKGDWYMYVSHRFGTVKDGLSTFFGLDNANTKIQLVYGLWEGFQIGLSRESLRRTFAGSAKWSLALQQGTFPVNITLYETVNLNTQLSKQQYPNMKYPDRLSYASQLLISRRFSSKLSLEVAPTFVRQNLVLEHFQQHNQVAMGVGGRLMLNKHISLNMDYILHLNRAEQSAFVDPFTIGVDIETGGHVFQLLFSNAQSTNEPGFISNAEGNWWEGDIFFGFNLVRVF